MFTHHYTQGIVLSKKPIRESDEVITLYTREYGLVEAVGKSIRKGTSKLKMNTPLFSLTEVGFIEGKSYNTLTDAKLIASFKEARKDIIKLSLFYRFSEMVTALIRGEEKDEEVFSFVLDSFEKVDKIKSSRKKAKVFYYLFAFRLLSLLGHSIEVEKCAFCEREVEKRCHFAPEEGKVFCGNCLKKKKRGIYSEKPWILKKLADRS